MADTRAAVGDQRCPFLREVDADGFWCAPPEMPLRVPLRAERERLCTGRRHRDCPIYRMGTTPSLAGSSDLRSE